MKIHEYQAKELFAKYHVPVENGILCRNVEEAILAYSVLEEKPVVIKAQVLTGGRGKAGGVKLAKNVDEVRDFAGLILGMNIKGYIVDRILVTQAVDIAVEYYLSFVIDRNLRSVVLMISRQGGVDIEDVARKTPEKIYKFVVDSSVGIPDFFARRAAFTLFENMDHVKQMVSLIRNLYRLMIDTDASLVEVNPLVLTREGRISAVDAKMVFDDNALFRHPDIRFLRESTEEERKEQIAKSKGFSYVGLDGNIGCMVNGAGLAMATMDIIKHFGGNPANFLDIGGSSNPEKVVDAMALLLGDPNVKVVMINIFGGITRCDDMASGLLKSFGQIETKIPVIVRLTGTNEKEGRELLKNGPFILAETMEEATRISITHAELQK
ncbi:MAG: ADP-forming succinate--CoA ligase subunit beta [Dysgonamonadaceae bacterium]|jgi:succinyl-CoA synthetase beta subunit|nr:ADP-forming succinate--CoA ligase subunit beta [Dysgonamonadaceae bacterium]